MVVEVESPAVLHRKVHPYGAQRDASLEFIRALGTGCSALKFVASSRVDGTHAKLRRGDWGGPLRVPNRRVLFCALIEGPLKSGRHGVVRPADDGTRVIGWLRRRRSSGAIMIIATSAKGSNEPRGSESDGRDLGATRKAR
jgi:hypothetical protein